MKQLIPEVLTPASYARYGQVVMGNDPANARSANQNTATRFNHLVSLENLRGSDARGNLAVFHCKPADDERLSLKLLEKHPLSTQVFIPMVVSRYLVVVSLGDEQPDLETLAVFMAGPGQGVSYRPGVWHHPMIALDTEAQFACLVWEDDTERDCVLHTYDRPYARVIVT